MIIHHLIGLRAEIEFAGFRVLHLDDDEIRVMTRKGDEIRVRRFEGEPRQDIIAVIKQREKEIA